MVDVAKLAGTSTQTVSRVLSRPELVSEATRKLVEDAVRQLNYIPNSAARLLASTTSRIRVQRSLRLSKMNTAGSISRSRATAPNCSTRRRHLAPAPWQLSALVFRLTQSSMPSGRVWI